VIALGRTFKESFEPADNVTILRNLSKLELRWIYQRARAVLVITKANSHGSGLTVIKEAMAMACPVIATDTPGLRDIIEPGKTGFLVPVGDIKAIQQAVEILTNNPDFGCKIGLAGREFVMNDRCFQRNNREYADVLLKLLGSPRSQ
jgi:glycosyltransferase involved in cell wall biosynthesis